MIVTGWDRLQALPAGDRVQLSWPLGAVREGAGARRASRGEPRGMGPVIVAVLEDSCGNIINLVQPET